MNQNEKKERIAEIKRGLDAMMNTPGDFTRNETDLMVDWLRDLLAFEEQHENEVQEAREEGFTDGQNNILESQ